ncbi:MAG TPA: aminotransferase class V-fold PLP-dependent enzyme [Anaerolineales bacterium]|nr:aminotransferase class V-fold PLP-dependent enzyme [Anaerolineales bacterium]
MIETPIPGTEPYTALFAGTESRVPVLDGSLQRYTNLDSAASTPTLKSALAAIERFMDHYASVHRGMGFKSQLSTHFFEKSREVTLAFLRADPEEHTCIFVKNATEGLNILAHRIPFTTERDVVITSGMEHHSNDLPWRNVGRVVHVKTLPDGRMDLDDFDRCLRAHGDRTALVTISGASNVTGFINPTGKLARKTHAAGALFAVDCAQLAPHRAIDMRPLDDPEHFDFAVISAHKLYAPFGSGALVGRKDIFAVDAPFMSGGGTVKIVTYDDHVWGDPRDEAGSPNTVGAIAMAAAMRTLEEIGMDAVAAHEAELTARALDGMTAIGGITIFGDRDPANAANRLGVIPFAIEGMTDVQAAAILAYEFGIGARNGRFCAYPYTMRLLGLSAAEEAAANARILSGDIRTVPGLVRVSFGLYNTPGDVDRLLHALDCVAHRKFQGTYIQDPVTGDFIPEGWRVRYEDYFDFR